MAENITPEAPEVVAQTAKTVGDENLEVRRVEPVVVADTVDAQVPGQPDEPSKVVRVHEVAVATDRVITDTSDPLAVQIPDAGRGSLDLPIHGLAAPTVEEVFEKEAPKASRSKS